MSARRRYLAVLAPLAVTAAVAVAGCASPSNSDVAPAAEQVSAGGSASSSSAPPINVSPDQHRVSTAKVDSIAALVPAAIRKRGTIIVTGSAGSSPPLRFYADDDTTVIGSETDFAFLFADVLGLKVQLHSADWAQNFVQIDSGKSDAFISNVTVTEERKQKYDFATYRKDNLAFEAKAGSALRIHGAKGAAGKTIGVDSGTNQEKLLVDWSNQDVAAGLSAVNIKYYQSAADYYLALASGRLDAYLGPNPSAAYHVAAVHQTEIVGTQSGAGPTLQGEIAVLTKKGNGLAAAFAAAINHTIANGSYAKVLQRWNLGSEAIATSRVNPPGLPGTN